jgi:hypothetical protein
MAIKTVIESTDGLDEAIAALYTEQDGKFVLDLPDEEIEKLPSVRGLSTANRENAKKAQDRLDAIESMKAQIAELQKGAPDTAATQAKITALEEKLAAKEAEAGEWRGKYTGITRDQSLRNALTSAKVADGLIDGAIALVTSKYKVEVDDSGNTFIDAGMGPRTVADFAKQWAASEGAAFVTKPQGAGVKGGETMKAKTITRAEFEALNADQRMATVKEGIAIAD